MENKVELVTGGEVQHVEMTVDLCRLKQGPFTVVVSFSRDGTLCDVNVSGNNQRSHLTVG